MSATHSKIDPRFRADAVPAPGPRATSVRPRMVALLDVDPDLGAGMPAERLAVARYEVRATALTVPRGTWSGEDLPSLGRPNSGLLVLEGVLACETVLEDTVSTELLGPGDLIRPWPDDEPPGLLKPEVRWQVLAEAQVAVLGPAFARRAVRFPEISAALTDRALQRARRLAMTQAISHLNSVERRLCALFWHLAERWGRVTADGVVVPLALSHRLLGELVGARRPTVTTSLSALERQGKVRRREDATWLLTGDAPGAPAEQVRRIVLHRRRLLSEQPRAALRAVNG